MARMWPRQPPPDVLNNPLRAAECDVFRRLETELDGSWWVFYSRPWHGVTSTGEEIDGECDFVVAHAQYGMLCIEVKGGQVAWDPETDQWTSRDSWQVTHRIKDPVRQAMTSKHQLLDKLKALPGCKGRWLTVRHGVILPACAKITHVPGADRPQFIFCFAEEYRKNLGGWIISRFAAPQERRPDEEGLGIAGMEALRNLLALPLSFRTPLAHLIQDDDRELTFLTQQQYHLLSAIEDLPRVCIQGGAGTGKTVLATHLAEKLARESGFRTLLVCYNEALARCLARELEDVPRLTVSSFHSLCLRTLKEAGATVPVSSDTHRFFEELLPEAVLALPVETPQSGFDAIVADEGQDFRELWWLVLESLLSAAGPKRLRVFFDANQRFYGDGAALLKTLTAAPIRLSWNLRNTRAVHEVVYRYYRGKPVSCMGPAGDVPTSVFVQDEIGMRSALGELVSRLVNRESLDPEDIAILVSTESWISRLVPERLIAGLLVSDASERRPGCVVIDTVRRFKGLEARLVVLIADDQLIALSELCYVALSRARSRIFLLGTAPAIGAILAADGPGVCPD
jgi:hypothetical protein